MASRSKEVIVPLYSALGETPPGMPYPAVESSTEEGYEIVGASPEKDKKLLRGLKHLPDEDRLRNLELFSLEGKKRSIFRLEFIPSPRDDQA
ncbi:hypothetical protein HGM15179_009386 [Zosterops borbonicus]|uniref:Uncharacterized protein n=1 Tax=Zosterops borbonicus TaxID=364589 RepID=A0A8K1GFB4_9PASS|nr:hypothetical protein HGM15179_009386 [Zosterops borbonicus]